MGSTVAFDRTHWLQPQGSLTPRWLTMPLLLGGPVISVLLIRDFVGLGWLPAIYTHLAMLFALALWSPFFVSFPGMLLQDVRDETLDHMRGPLGSLLRGLILVPYMCLSRTCPARLEANASVLGLLIAVAVAIIRF